MNGWGEDSEGSDLHCRGEEDYFSGEEGYLKPRLRFTWPAWFG